MALYPIKIARGQWHKLFGHPMDEVQVEDNHQPGLHRVTFTCGECGRSFDKNICSTCKVYGAHNHGR